MNVPNYRFNSHIHYEPNEDGVDGGIISIIIYKVSESGMVSMYHTMHMLVDHPLIPDEVQSLLVDGFHALGLVIEG